MIKFILENLDLLTKQISLQRGAAVSGESTTFIEQPNTIPQATQKLLQEKFDIAENLPTSITHLCLEEPMTT